VQPAGRGAHEPGADSRERRFAGAVLSDDGVNPSAVERDADIVQRDDVAVRNGDVVALERRQREPQSI
jgi:hypothetical protein